MLLQQGVDPSAGVLVGGVVALLVSAVVGGVIGWLASIVMKTNAQMGIVANVLVGIVGSMAGGWVFRLLGLPVGSTLMAVLAAIAGSVLLIVLLRALKILK
jgi:uncharacterized membrane protein YeaQ/YmgE (transglycosylase-associated protein family)